MADARGLAAAAFRRAGAGETEAGDSAEILTLAESMGIETHGLARVADYVGRIAAGGIDAGATPEVVTLAPALRLVDCKGGLGPAAARRALAEAMSAAGTLGVGAAFVRHGSHIGALAPYLWIAAEGGFASIVSTNTAPMIAPAGGREARVGNNPLGIGIPYPGGTPVLLDMALSVVSRSRIRAAERAGRAILEDWATDADGRPTSDPGQAMRGLLRAIGGDKGANLALGLDLMTGLLSGSAMLSEVSDAGRRPEKPQNLGQLFIAIDAGRLMSTEALAGRMADAERIVNATPPLDDDRPVRLPGARAVEALQVAVRDGLDLAPSVLEDLRKLAG